MEIIFWILGLGLGWWALISFVVAIFVPDKYSMFFMMVAWALLGIWFLEMGIEGYREKHVGAFVAANDVDIYGNWAVVIAIFEMFLATLIFILPGVGIAYQEIRGWSKKSSK
ncbi:hypothetical protein HOG48_06450 [Candidatus Peregrinibacteria bacterium]|nr:hypothetical protein [Candidatus Peregrinibacteria bacterium]